MTETLSREAIDLLLARKARLLVFLEKRVGSRADAEDLLQTAMLRVLEKGGSLRDEGRLLPWFHRLLQNLIVSWYRRRASAAKLAERLEVSRVPAPQVDELLFTEACACVLDVLATLKSEYADVLRRVALEDQPLADVAHELGTSRSNVSVRLHRARRALVKRLGAVCGACLEHCRLYCDCRVGRTSGALGRSPKKGEV